MHAGPFSAPLFLCGKRAIMTLQMLTLRVKKLTETATVPSYAHPGDAGMDLFACEGTVVRQGDRTLVGTGVAMEIPDGYVGLVWDKSGLSNNHGLKTLGGVIDAGYRGEVKVGLVNLSDKDYTVRVGEKVAQMLIQKVERAAIEEVSELSDTSRGEGGFGSTGK